MGIAYKNEYKESVYNCLSDQKQEVSAVPSINTQNKSDLGNQTNIENADDHFSKSIQRIWVVMILTFKSYSVDMSGCNNSGRRQCMFLGCFRQCLRRKVRIKFI